MAKIHEFANHAPHDPERIVVFNPTLHAVIITSEGHRLRSREWASVCPSDPKVQQGLAGPIIIKHVVPVSTVPSAAAEESVATTAAKPKRGRKPSAKAATGTDADPSAGELIIEGTE